jgi:positive regulator of sigma E activity
VVEPVAYWCLQFRLPIGSLLASAFLFFIPLALLAMVGPFFVPGMSSKEPYVALGAVALWGIYGFVYFLRTSKAKGVPAFATGSVRA